MESFFVLPFVALGGVAIGIAMIEDAAKRTRLAGSHRHQSRMPLFALLEGLAGLISLIGGASLLVGFLFFRG